MINPANLPYEWQIGWRYLRAGRADRRNGFVSFISLISVVGIALGVAALIIVLSVMNGFQKEVRSRMLAAIAQVELLEPRGAALAGWQALAQQARQDPEVVAAAPLIEVQSLVARGEQMLGAVVRGVSPEAEAGITDLAARLKADGTLDRLQPGLWNIVLGAELARSLGVQVGDAVTLVASGGGAPLLKRFTVAGLFRVGHYQYDSALALVHLDDAAQVFRVGGASAVQLRLKDADQAPAVRDRLVARLGDRVLVRDWTGTNATWYEAVQLQKRMMFIILSLIVAVAAFNLVSSLVMTVTDKRADIAILRTLGASPRSVMGIFMVQGAASGLIGTAAGVGLGLLVASNIGVIVPAIERLLGVSLLSGSVYILDHMPSDPQAADIVPIVLLSLLLALLATLYPSWRASRVNPAEALRYE
ncbi:MAG TPA: lipoprotein-releasing ABC transporter permease subunit [Ideonella sp.]|nr:lipoprotein-releasing ABC transporter permease subunit [Ideonella sp.]